MCTAKIRKKDKSIKYRFFVVPGNGPALFAMPDIKLLSMITVTCDVMGEPCERRKCNSQTIEMSNRSSCRTNEAHVD